MYAVKPWGKVFLVGRTAGSLALGIGMRWRESEVEIVDRAPDPYQEVHMMRRCVLPENTVKQLEDLGCTRSILMRHLVPAKKWKFVTMSSLDVLREGSQYPGCSPMEPVYHAPEGHVIRALRTEFMRFGGSTSWGSEAYDAFESNDGTMTWTLRKQYGPGSDAQAIISFCENPVFNKQLIVEDPEKLVVLFDVRTGVCRDLSKDLVALFGGEYDVSIVLGRGMAVHMWTCSDYMKRPVVAWRWISKGRSDVDVLLQDLHPVLRHMMDCSEQKETYMMHLPATIPAVRDDAHHHRVSVMGDALLPVDPFEWRGDRLRTSVEEAAALCRGIYGKKYHRGHVPQILRGAEQDIISRRAFLLRRDLVDAEHFLAVHPQLPAEEGDQPQLKRVGA